jgi:hypothetical protein
MCFLKAPRSRDGGERSTKTHQSFMRVFRKHMRERLSNPVRYPRFRA